MRHVIDQVLTKEYDLIPFMIDAHQNAHVAIEFVDQVGFVAVSLSAA